MILLLLIPPQKTDIIKTNFYLIKYKKDWNTGMNVIHGATTGGIIK